MALFKISKGQSENLSSQPLTEGYSWFTPDDGKFYIDAKPSSSSAVQRIPLNAHLADNLRTPVKISLTTGALGNTNFDGSKDVQISVTSLKEAYLDWGGRNLTGQYSALDAALVPVLGANRLAFMPAAGVTIEYSRDGGSTWTNYGASDQMKVQLFDGEGTSLRLGGDSSQTGVDKSNYQVRVTIDSVAAKVYTQLKKFVIDISTEGSTGSWVTIDGKTRTNVTAGTDTWTTFINRQGISGWSAFNVINVNGITTYSNNNAQYQKLRFTFGVTSHASTIKYPGLTIRGIYGYGGMGWTTPSNLASRGTIYTYDYQQNVIFPKNISVASLTIRGGAGVQAAAPTDPTHLVNKKYVDDSFHMNDAMLFKGVLGVNVAALPDDHQVGWTYKVGVAGSYAGQWCEPGDTVYCITDRTSANDADWVVLEYNQEGLVIRATDDRSVAIGSDDSPVYVQANGVVKATSKKFSDYLPLAGGTLTGNLKVGSSSIGTNGYIEGTWLKTTHAVNKGSGTGKVAVIDSAGWIYYRTPKEILEEAGGGGLAKRYTVTCTVNQTSISFPTTFSNLDSIAVYHNGLLLTPTINYTINADGAGIDLVGYNAEEGDLITFVATVEASNFTDEKVIKGEVTTTAGQTVINIPFTITSTTGLAVYENGILISEGNQYTATTTAITLLGYTANSGDIYTFVSDRALAGLSLTPNAATTTLSSSVFSGVTNVKDALEKCLPLSGGDMTGTINFVNSFSIKDKNNNYIAVVEDSDSNTPAGFGIFAAQAAVVSTTNASNGIIVNNSMTQLIGNTVVSGASTTSGAAVVRNIMYSTSVPTSSQGEDGDICIVYTP